jgi:hypothetical protein
MTTLLKGKIGSGILLDRNPISSPELMKKYKIGTDHLVDFLAKRLTDSECIDTCKLTHYQRKYQQNSVLYLN